MNVFGHAIRVGAGILVVVATTSVLSMNPIARIVVSKSERTLVAYDASGVEVARHPVIVGAAPIGTKQREGDRRTPEGAYRVCFKNPKSRFHLSLGLDYPSADDARRALHDGRIGLDDYEAIVEAARGRRIPPWKTPLGGEIFIHGEMREGETTAGCIALTNEAIEDLYRRVSLGTEVQILP
jgi:murein L,D-transpeptidase YafK